MRSLQKGEIVRIIKTPSINLYGIQQGNIYRVFENCLTSEKSAGYVLRDAVPHRDSKCNEYIYLTTSEMEQYTAIIEPATPQNYKMSQNANFTKIYGKTDVV